jgi:DUF2905 family protein
MLEWGSLGKFLVGIGLATAVLGALCLLADRIPGLSHLFGWVGRLPGDISIKRDNFSLFFPLGTGILVSILLSLVSYLLSWLFRR